MEAHKRKWMPYLANDVCEMWSNMTQRMLMYYTFWYTSQYDQSKKKKT